MSSYEYSKLIENSRYYRDYTDYVNGIKSCKKSNKSNKTNNINNNKFANILGKQRCCNNNFINDYNSYDFYLKNKISCTNLVIYEAYAKYIKR
jgi:hypothetical protein